MKAALLIALASLAAMLACDSKTTEPTPVDPISISSPSSGTTLRDTQIIRASARSDFDFVYVVFVIDGDSVAVDSTRPYLYQWDIFQYDSGTSHILQAVGVLADSVLVSKTVTVTVRFDIGFSHAATYNPGFQLATGITVFQNALFISYLDAGLEMIDITSRTSPSFLARYFTAGQSRDAAVLFPYVYIADGNQGLAKALFTDVDSLIPTNRFNNQNMTYDVAAFDNLIFSLETTGLSILNPSNLNLYSRLALTQDLLKAIVVRNDTAFIVGNTSLFIIDCTAPSAPQIIGQFNNLNIASQLAVEDTFVFIANGSEGLTALSISNAASPRFLARYDPGFIMTGVDAGDGTIFAGVNSGLVYALDFDDQGNLVSLDDFNVGGIISEIDYESHYLYIAATSSVEILRYAR